MDCLYCTHAFPCLILFSLREGTSLLLDNRLLKWNCVFYIYIAKINIFARTYNPYNYFSKCRDANLALAGLIVMIAVTSVTAIKH